MSDERDALSGRIGLDRSQAELCAQFLGWQCRVRQLAARRDQGRPASGMRPVVILPDKSSLGPITVLIIRRAPEESSAQFRHLALKTHDPEERFGAVLRVLQATHYQYPEEFADLMTALFAIDSPACESMVAAARCTLVFNEGEQVCMIPCAMRLLEEDHPAFQATYWHNKLFNPALPGVVQVLAFLPDWSAASAEPPFA